MLTFAACIPVLLLLFCLLFLKLSAAKSGALSLLASLIVGWLVFGMNITGVSVALSKGMSLALYVLLIIWAAIFLYQLLEQYKAVDVIAKNVILFIKDPFAQFLMLSWLFSSVLQGIAGFGVPVIIVVPILLRLGFDPIKSAAAVLLGHCWSVSFGSMGSSYFTIFLVSKLPQQSLGYAMILFDAAAMVLMGFFVCFIHGEFASVRKGVFYVIPSSLAMVAVMLGTVRLEMHSLVGLLSALAGLLTMAIMYIVKEKPSMPEAPFKGELTLGQALLPYSSVIALSLLFGLLPLGKLFIAFRYPETSTALGYLAVAESAYAKIKIFGHPAPVIVLSIGLSALVYAKLGVWRSERFHSALRKTVAKCIPTSVSLTFLISMALVMMDSGMTAQLAQGAAAVSGGFYPLFAPLVGILGSFITGSNTNSNIIFGKFQFSVAESLGVSTVLMCGLQSIAGSVGVSIGPTNILMAASATGMSGQESRIYKKVMAFVLLAALALGVINFLLLMVFKVHLPGGIIQ